MPKKKPTFSDDMPKAAKISDEQMEALFAQISESNLDSEAAKFIEMAIRGNAWLIEQLELGRLSIAKLRKLFQIQGSETSRNRKPQNDPASFGRQTKSNTNELKAGHGRNNADAYEGASIVDVPHPELKPGDTCIEEACDGRLYEMSDPGTLIRVTGAPLRVKPGSVRRIAGVAKKTAFSVKKLIYNLKVFPGSNLLVSALILRILKVWAPNEVYKNPTSKMV